MAGATLNHATAQQLRGEGDRGLGVCTVSLSLRYIHVRRTASHSGGPEALKQTQLTTVTLAQLLNAPVKV